MSNITRRNVLITVVSCLIIMLAFGGCSIGYERSYYDDICIPLESQPGEIIIREWVFLLGSGAEIYYKNNDKEIMLGQLSGGDDGYCPFQNGQYAVTVDGSELTIEWCIYPNSEANPWNKKVFEIPPASETDNDFLLWGIIAGGVVLAGGVVAAVILIRKKINAETESY